MAPDPSTSARVAVRGAPTAPWTRPALRRARIGLVAAVAGLLAACGGTAGAAKATRIDVTMSDFAIHVSRTDVPAGRVVLRVTNNGPSTHEINVDGSPYPAGGIPRQRDGITANEEAHGLHRIDSIEEVDLRQTSDLTVNLRPGRYVLWCNLEGHYLGGMHRIIRVH
jgi:uncharacterized cupredoxin-like copper-binding protein